tara:strand:+ start:427 stop:897 length:471 start_codon:yes stop_codon:yes gene_type:complete
MGEYTYLRAAAVLTEKLEFSVKVTKRQLRRIIREEKRRMLNEAGHPRVKSSSRDLMFNRHCADPGSRDRLQKILRNMGMIDEMRAFEEVGGNQPIFHDAAMDEALNDYVEKFVDYLEEDIGESRGTLALLETLKGYLVDAMAQATLSAKRDAGIRD